MDILIPQSEYTYNASNGYIFKTNDFVRFFKNNTVTKINAKKEYVGLKLNGVQVTPTTNIPLANIGTGQLQYKPTNTTENINLLEFKVTNEAVFPNEKFIIPCKMIGSNTQIGNITEVYLPLMDDQPITYNTTILISNVNSLQFTLNQVIANIPATTSEGKIKITSKETKLIQGSGILNIQIEYTPLSNVYSHSVIVPFLNMQLVINIMVNGSPIVEDFTATIANRNITYSLLDLFIWHYNDPDLDAMTEVRLSGVDTTKFTIDDIVANTSTPYVDNSWINLSDFIIGVSNLWLKYTPTDTDLPYDSVFSWQAKDWTGKLSNIATFTVHVNGI